MAKSVSIPIALSELKRSSFRRLSSRKDKKKSVSTPLSGFVILVEKIGGNVKLYGTTGDCSNLAVGDEIIAINDKEVSEQSYDLVIPYLQECIRTKIIQLKVRRREDTETPEAPSTSSQASLFVDAYLVSVDREHIKEVTRRLKKDYPDLRIYDMESIASEARKTTACSLAVPNQMNGDDKLKKYDKEFRERENDKLQRQKENDFLRSSLRASHKLKSLATCVEAQPPSAKTSDTNVNKSNGYSTAIGYENQCFSDGGLSPQAAAEKLENCEAIPLKEVISSVERVATRLSEIDGTEENSKILRDFFTSIHIQQAIQATAEEKERAVLHKPVQRHSSLKQTAIPPSQPSHRVRIADEASVKFSSQMGNTNDNSTGFASISSAASTSRIADENGDDYGMDDGKNETRMKIVTIHKGEDSYLGATVKNDENRILIGRVIKGGIIEKTGIFDEGDELVEINDTCLRGKQVNEVCDILRNLHGEVKFLIASKGIQKKRQPSTVLHLRALFDYDPEDDVYVPCKELAMKFQRGDILHVLNTSDENWWQAYREGEDTTLHLAGLIPSSSFRQQVMIYMEEMEREGSKSCRKKEGRKKIPEMLKSLGRSGSKEIAKSADEDGLSHTSIYPGMFQILGDIFL
ncbi:hypothetical protein WR25_05856 isoform B [Diploscapter pachys]|uniref:PDZ domain-containing protein n=1 Tax=Diploscapter pachys TaxID=2018661 RepID=A0A2A2L713_9BILA|nr:hypothetical protein WR25_05856 isoform B [Diploscapter pachys]